MIVLGGLVGCQAKVTIKDPVAPLSVSNQQAASLSVGIVMVDSALKDKEVGHMRAGLATIPYMPYKGDKAFEASSLYPVEVESELKAAGYSLVGVGSSRMFDASGEERTGADYQIAGMMSDLKYSTFDSVGGVFTESTATVDWKVMDMRTRKIVYEKRASGEASGPPSSTSTIAGAVRGSLQKVLADERFVRLMTRK
jgi:hypothetical protein